MGGESIAEIQSLSALQAVGMLQILARKRPLAVDKATPSHDGLQSLSNYKSSKNNQSIKIVFNATHFVALMHIIFANSFSD